MSQVRVVTTNTIVTTTKISLAISVIHTSYAPMIIHQSGYGKWALEDVAYIVWKDTRP